MIIILMVLLIWEPFPIGFISLLIPVFLVILSPWTEVSGEEALSGFSNKATITVMSMFVLSKGIQNSGAVQFIGNKIEEFTGDNVKKQVGVISSLTGLIASIINNTPVVAAFVPMVTNLAHRTKVSPSKLLIPLSYASMLGGTITLFGTSTNILASQVSDRLIGHPFSMFEFSHLGLIVLTIGIFYLITIGHNILPERITPSDDIIKEYGIEDFLVEVKIKPDSSLIGKEIAQILEENQYIDIIKVIRDEVEYIQPLDVKTVREKDHLIISAVPGRLEEFKENKAVEVLSDIKITQKKLENTEQGHQLIEMVVPDNSFVEHQTVREVNFLERYDASLLAIRHGKEVIYKRLIDTPLKAGDVLLLLVTDNTLKRLKENINFIIEERKANFDFEGKKIALSFGIVGTVIFFASLNIVSIAIAALAGVVAMVSLGVVEPQKAYEAINWEVFFLLSGLIPLGIAVEQSGTAQYLAFHILTLSEHIPPVVLLGVFYFITAMLAAAIGNNASVVLMLPVAVKAALQLGINPFAFVLTVTFAASGSFLSPIGYQTNLMVYGPGGYKFSDYIWVGAPLQLILTFIVPIFVTLFWGL
uniref:Di-/tricarboxylate transporter n=1 Tax=uncultured organism TaxID=155900 RepID=M1Q2A3_9ZZZZ|nr:di-/tricarboxylate transporter [uncultured organism]